MSDENDQGAPPDKPAPGPEEAPAQAEDQQAGNDLIAEWEAMAGEGDDGAAGGDAGEESDPPGGVAAPGNILDEPAINQVDLETYAILGTSNMPVSQLLRMGRGAVVELNTTIGDQIELRINDMPIAMGEVVVVEDRIAVEVTEILKRTGK